MAEVRRWERELIEHMRSRHPEIGQHLRERGDLPDEILFKLRDAVAAFKESFMASLDREGA